MIGAVLAIAAVVLFLALVGTSWWEKAKLARALRRAPRIAIRALPEATRARIVGTVAAEATLRAPLTGRTCVAYVVHVEERVSNGKTTTWTPRIHEVKSVPFTVDDGTGRALVDPGQAQLLVEMDSTTRSGPFDEATAAEAGFLERHGMAAKGWFLRKNLRYLEGVIEPGERVAVLGRAVREPDPGAVAQVTGYRDELPTRVRIGGTKEQPIIVSDRPDTTR
jgi:hypothetical protein